MKKLWAKALVSVFLAVLLQAKAVHARPHLYGAEFIENPSIFFCKNESDARSVLSVYAKASDVFARIHANHLVFNKGVCEYLEGGFDIEEQVPCEVLPRGYCISVQPAFAFEGGRGTERMIKGYFLLMPLATDGYLPPPRTAVMDTLYRTIIFDLND